MKRKATMPQLSPFTYRAATLTFQYYSPNMHLSQNWINLRLINCAVCAVHPPSDENARHAVSLLRSTLHLVALLRLAANGAGIRALQKQRRRLRRRYQETHSLSLSGSLLRHARPRAGASLAGVELNSGRSGVSSKRKETRVSLLSLPLPLSLSVGPQTRGTDYELGQSS